MMAAALLDKVDTGATSEDAASSYN